MENVMFDILLKATAFIIARATNYLWPGPTGSKINLTVDVLNISPHSASQGLQ
jgi:hypothetical protein